MGAQHWPGTALPERLPVDVCARFLLETSVGTWGLILLSIHIIARIAS
jgi:hypothetical protein